MRGGEPGEQRAHRGRGGCKQVTVDETEEGRRKEGATNKQFKKRKEITSTAGNSRSIDNKVEGNHNSGSRKQNNVSPNMHYRSKYCMCADCTKQHPLTPSPLAHVIV